LARPAKAPSELRTERYNLRFTAGEIEYVRSQADAARLTVMEYIRRRALEYRVPSGAGERRADPALISEINRVGVQLAAAGNLANQLARSSHSGRAFRGRWQDIAGELERCQRDVESLLDRLAELAAGAAGVDRG